MTMPPPTPLPTKSVSHSHQHHPLKSAELTDIRSLLGVASAATATNAATIDDDTPAQGPRPLAGRRVMVPALFASSSTTTLSLKSSSKSAPRAFFEGVLQPTVAENSSTNTDAASSAMNEIIHVNVVGNSNNNNGDEPALVEMTRTEALDYFDDHRKNENPATVTSSSVPTKPTSRSSTSGKSNTFKEEEEAIQSSNEICHPLIEIREICNNQGQIQHSEVVNMSNVMNRLGERLRDVASLDNDAHGGGKMREMDGGGDDDNNFDDEKRLGKLLAQTLVGVGQDEIMDGITSLTGREEFDDNYSGTDDEHVNIPDTLRPDTKKKVIIDETKYQELRSRLDELERLEEEEKEYEEEKKKGSKKKSLKMIESGGSSINSRNPTATTSLGSGWSRGFLNSTRTTNATSKEKKKVGDPMIRTQQYANAKEEEVYSTRVTFSSDEKIRTEINPPISSKPSSPNSARVKFSSRDDTITTTEDNNIISGGGSVDDGESSSTMMSLSPSSAKVSFTVSDDTISLASSSSSSRMLLHAVPSAPSLVSSSSNSSAKVTFSDDDVITEIPRIGQSRVPPRPVSSPRPVYFNTTPSTPTMSLSKEESPSFPPSSIPIEENIFGGVVKERTSVEDTSGDRTESVPSHNISVGDGGKKLSRFAQQRLQRG